ncbi:MAG: DUF4424 family protein [Hyphomicrobiaceae bacterium]
MRRRRGIFAWVVAFTQLAAVAVAQSPPSPTPTPATPSKGTRELPTGGLLLVPDYALVLDAYDLTIGRDEIRAVYTLSNPTPEPRAITVAFPLPDIDALSIGEQTVNFPKTEPLNFVGASLSADGVAMTPRFQQRAIILGLDVTTELEALRVPLFPYRSDMADQLRRLPDVLIKEFQERGLARYERDNLVPGWTLKTTAYWRHTIAPGKPSVLSLSYMPVMGSGTPEGNGSDGLGKSYCLDAVAEAAVAKHVGAVGASSPPLHWLTYNLTSGAGASLQAAQFRLRIGRSAADAAMATCRKDSKPVGPTVLEWTAKDFYPDDDIAVLFIR